MGRPKLQLSDTRLENVFLALIQDHEYVKGMALE